MSPALAALPPAVALIVAGLVLLGAGVTLIGTLGLLRFGDFYDRLHAPSLGTGWGTAAVLIAVIAVFSVLEGRLVLAPLVIGCLVMVTTPATMLVIGRAALQRDRAEGRAVPPPAGDDQDAG